MTGSSSAAPYLSPQWKSVVAALDARFDVPCADWRAIAEAARVLVRERGFPTLRDEDWKYTSLMPLHERARAMGMASLKLNPLPKGVILRRLSECADAADVLRRHANWGDGFFNLLCRALVADPWVLTIDSGAMAVDPIEIQWIGVEGQFSLGFLLIDVGPKKSAGVPTRVSIVENYGGHVDATALVTSVWLGQGAVCEHLRVQKAPTDGESTVVVGDSRLFAEKDAVYRHLQISSGATTARESAAFVLAGQGACVELNGLYAARGRQLLDHHTCVTHMVGMTESRQSYKGLLSDDSRAVFNGRIEIEKYASGSNASQLNKNLLLSKKCEVDTKPELAIDNDNVKAAHGATIGRLDQEHIFYLQSRGLDAQSATEFLARGFALEVAENLESKGLKARARSAIEDSIRGMEAM